MIILKAFGKKLKAMWPHLKVVLSQTWFPILLAFGASIYDWKVSNKSFHIIGFMKIFFPTLFFIMWFVGIYERAKKRNHDKDSFEGLNTGLQSLTSLVNELKHSRQPQPVAIDGSLESPSFSRSLMDGAKRIFNEGHKLAALLQAGVAFERAVKAFAEKKGLKEAEQLPLLRILQKIDFLIPEAFRGEIHMLRKIRNRLAHASTGELENIGDADLIFHTYDQAISALEKSIDLQ